MKKMIKKAVIPVAGRGTRIMPLTLHQPKAMVGIIDRPIIHYVIDEVVAAGIKDITLIVGSHQNQKHFSQYLTYLKKDPEWQKIRFRTAIQKKPLGNGHAILAARHIIGQEPFLLLWSDDIIAPKSNERPAMAQLIDFYEELKAPIIALEAFPWKSVSRMGVVDAVRVPKRARLYKVNALVEKPPLNKAPSNLTIDGRYVITPDIVENLEELLRKNKFKAGELWLTDALALRLKKGSPIYGWRYPNHRFDCGSKIGIAKAQAYFALHHKEFKTEFRRYLKKTI
jgi:UTP--glucose-1-phosphate uridylyltransferase